jgi:hypothetical protein
VPVGIFDSLSGEYSSRPEFRGAKSARPVQKKGGHLAALSFPSIDHDLLMVYIRSTRKGGNLMKLSLSRGAPKLDPRRKIGAILY